MSWSGQFEFPERAGATLKLVVPFTPLLIFVPLYRTFKHFGEALFLAALDGDVALGAGGRGIGLLYGLGHTLSVAGVVGFIALAGVAGMILLLSLKQVWFARLDQNQSEDSDLLDAICEGAMLRLWPKAMTVAVILSPASCRSWSGGRHRQRGHTAHRPRRWLAA